MKITLFLVVLFSYLLQNASAAYGTEFYVGAMRNYRGETHNLYLYITTPSVSSVSFSIKTTNGSIGSYNVNSSVPVDISLPTSLVTNDGLYSSRFKGVYINSTNGGLISVLVVNVRSTGTFGDYMAYPYQNLALSEYQYYAVSTGTLATSDNSLSEVLLVGNEDNTTVTVIPTQTVSVPIDIQTNSNSKTVTANSSFTFTIHKMQTFLIGAPLLDISGTSIVSNEPLTVISGHECGNIPLVCCCQQIAEQILPTIIWGREFLLTPYATRSVGPYFKVVAALGSTSLSFTCSASGGNNFYLQNAGDVTTLYSSSSYCSIISDKPVLVTQLGPSQDSGSGYGDPVISLIPPLELHQQNIILVIPGFSTIINNYINIATTTNGPLYLNGQLRSVTWNNIYNNVSSIIGYGTQIPLNTISTSVSYTISMQTAFTALVYGFGNHHGYSYSAGINPTGIDSCLSNNGGCDQLCTSTSGSYACSCHPGFSLDLNGYNCSDIDECADSDCEHICVNAIGSYSCLCNDGYSLNTNNRNCLDINECDTNNGGCGQDCINTMGSYQCQCREGFQFTSNGRSCTDIDECADKNGGCEQICNNTVGSFQCSCLVGFTLTNNAFCLDINECALVDNRCSHDCVNTPGSYHCTCKDGYYLSNDNHACLACEFGEVINGTICEVATPPTNNGAVENPLSSIVIALAISLGLILIVIIIGTTSCIAVLLIVTIYKRKKKQPYNEEHVLSQRNPVYDNDEIEDAPEKEIEKLGSIQ